VNAVPTIDACRAMSYRSQAPPGRRARGARFGAWHLWQHHEKAVPTNEACRAMSYRSQARRVHRATV